MFAEKFLEQLEQGKLVQGGGFQRIVEFPGGVGQRALLQARNQILRATRFAVQRLGMERQLTVGPWSGNPKARMDQKGVISIDTKRSLRLEPHKPTIARAMP